MNESQISKLLQYHSKYGNRWSVLSQLFQGFSPRQTKNEYYSYLKKIIQEAVSPDCNEKKLQDETQIRNFRKGLQIIKQVLIVANEGLGKKGGYRQKDSLLKKQIKKYKITLQQIHHFGNTCLIRKNQNHQASQQAIISTGNVILQNSTQNSPIQNVPNKQEAKCTKLPSIVSFLPSLPNEKINQCPNPGLTYQIPILVPISQNKIQMLVYMVGNNY